MTVYERTVAKMQQLPEPVLQEVSDFVDFLLIRQDQTQWELWTHFREALDLAESDFSDYLHNLETYEEGLAPWRHPMVTVVRGDVILCDLNPVVGTEQAAVTKPSHDGPILALYH
jgi:hypothetical protein